MVADGRLRQRVALVTGGASGIGRACGLGLAAEGAAVAIADIDMGSAELTADEICRSGGQAIAVAVDVGDALAVIGCVSTVIARYGRIDVLVNAAGVSSSAGLLDADVETWQRVHEVNLRAPFLFIQVVARHMIERGGGGRIITISSSGAFRAAGTNPVYSSSKAGVGGLTRSAAASLAPYDINVNCVAPGVTLTPLAVKALGGSEAVTERARSGVAANLFGRPSMPEDVAAAVVFLACPQSRQITGQTIHTSAGGIV
jgi:NAD(P)-dependent dehydrogenase (short-subunit alcohol dehydrogenase family)